MPQQQYIKFLREIEGCSINEIAETVGIHWRTARKYADKTDWNLSLSKTQRKSPVMEPYKEIVDVWLYEDRLLPRKQRHTAVRIYARLKQEHNYTGGQRTVTSYVSKRRQELDLEKAKTYERLEHPLGEAQVDFYTMEVSKDSQFMTYKQLVLSFPYSNAAFVFPTPAENQECFLEGLKRLFEQAGGVPERIWFDNLSAAVVRVEKHGQREVTEAFRRFSTHYRFEAVFCNPASGHEKGHVENKCGYGRRNWCVPVPLFESQEQLAEQFAELARQDMKRPHYTKGSSIQTLWEEEQKQLLKLPEVAFEVFRLESAVANKYGEIRTDQANLPLFGVRPGNEVLVKKWWDRLEVLDTNHHLIAQIPRPYTGKVTEIPWHEVFKGLSRKPRSVTHSQFAKMLPSSLFAYLSIADPIKRRERLEASVSWSAVYKVAEINKSIHKLGEQASVESVTSMLSLLGQGREIPAGFEERYTPEALRSNKPNLERYNLLASGGATV